MNALSGEVQEWNERLQKFIFTSAQEFGKVWSNQQQFADSIDHIDINVLALSHLIEKLYKEKDPEFSAEKYADEVREAFDIVQKDREEARKAVLDESEKEEDIEAAEQEAFEELVVQEMKEQTNTTVDSAATSEAEVPEEATIFGD